MIFKFSPLLSSCITSLCKRVGGLFKQALNFLVRKEIFPAGQQTPPAAFVEEFYAGNEKTQKYNVAFISKELLFHSNKDWLTQRTKYELHFFNF